MLDYNFCISWNIFSTIPNMKITTNKTKMRVLNSEEADKINSIRAMVEVTT